MKHGFFPIRLPWTIFLSSLFCQLYRPCSMTVFLIWLNSLLSLHCCKLKLCQNVSLNIVLHLLFWTRGVSKCSCNFLPLSCMKPGLNVHGGFCNRSRYNLHISGDRSGDSDCNIQERNCDDIRSNNDSRTVTRGASIQGNIPNPMMNAILRNMDYR